MSSGVHEKTLPGVFSWTPDVLQNGKIAIQFFYFAISDMFLNERGRIIDFIKTRAPGTAQSIYRLEHEGKVTMNNSAPRAKPEVHYYS